MMRSLLHLDPNTSQDDVLYGLSQAVESLVEDQAMDMIPYLAYMMGLDLGEEWAWVKKEDPKVRLKQTLWAASEFVTALAKKQPVVIALDDLHWADEASLTLIAHLLKVTDQAPVFFFLVMRALREHESWKLRDRAASQYPHRYLELLLEPLERPESALLLSKLLPGAVFDASRQDEILDKAAGNPFYLEEVVRSLMEAGAVIPRPEKPAEWVVTAKISQITVPVTLHAAIVARIDRLTEDARLALQMAAVIGRQFRVELLRHLAHAESEIEMWLAQLERGGLVRPGDLSVDPTFSFPDALVQEVAYDSVLVLNRQQLHRQIGEMLETAYPDEIDKNTELLAYHYSHSDNPDKALKYLKEAAIKAEARYANATAISYYKKILDIQRQRGDTGAQANALYAMGFRAYEIGDYPNARAWLDESVQLHRANHDPKSEGWSVLYLGMVDLKQGHYSAAAHNHQYALDSARQRGDRFQEGIHLTNLGRTVMRMGNYPRAMQLFTESQDIKKANNDIMGQGFALFYLGLTSIYQQNYAESEQFLVASLAMWEQVTDDMDNLGYKKDSGTASAGRQPVKKNDRGLAYCYQGLGLLCLARGEFAQAADYLTLSIAGCEKLVLKAELIESLSHLSQALLGLKDTSQALATSQRAVQLLAEQQDVEEEQAIYFNHYRVLRAANVPEAGEYLDKARRTVQEQAAQITDEADRNIFLQATRVNQQIHAAA
jgi:predicted ATPase